jgi:hypothetical protein
MTHLSLYFYIKIATKKHNKRCVYAMSVFKLVVSDIADVIEADRKQRK